MTILSNIAKYSFPSMNASTLFLIWISGQSKYFLDNGGSSRIFHDSYDISIIEKESTKLKLSMILLLKLAINTFSVVKLGFYSLLNDK